MDKETSSKQVQKIDGGDRPLGLSILLIFSFVFNGFVTLLLLAGLLYSRILKNVIEQYYQEFSLTDFSAIVILVVASLLFASAFFGSLKMWKMRKTGFYIYAGSYVVILATMILLGSYDFLNMAIAVVLIIIFGLYSHKMT